MGLALHCHGEQKLTKDEDGRMRRYKEEERVVPTSPSRPPSSPKSVFRVLHGPRCVPLAQNRRKRANLPHQRGWRLAEVSEPPGDSSKTESFLFVHRPAMAQAPPGAGPLERVPPGDSPSSARRWSSFPLFSYFLSSSCYSGTLTCLD